MIDVIVCREAQDSTSVEVYMTTPLISMIFRTAGSERNNSGHHTADPSAGRMTILSRRSESMEATREEDGLCSLLNLIVKQNFKIFRNLI